MKILVIGSGGREHAIAWKLAQSQQVEKVYVAPGNGGTALEERVENVAIAATDLTQLISFAQSHAIDFTVVGPEAPLAQGISDRFAELGLKCLGPSKQAAQLEASKEFAKIFMVQQHIPTAAYKTFTEIEAAKAYVDAQDLPIVIKADGLAAGKGVVIAHSRAEAHLAIHDMLQKNQFGDAGQRIVIEEFLRGEEASFIALCDGDSAIAFASSQDHKARDEGDKGPNTGGMGAYSPAPVLTPAIEMQVMKQVIEPVLAGMKQQGSPYVGFLYAGLMIMPSGEFKVLEFNCRLGDPETQVLLPRLQSDFAALCQTTLHQQLQKQPVLQWDPRPALGVVMAARGYPFDYPKGEVIEGLQSLAHSDVVKVFHAGTRQQAEQTLTNGGRVLCVTAQGDNLALAQQQAYAAVEHIHWQNCYYRRDIGFKAIS